jgi:hypothetical protein
MMKVCAGWTTWKCRGVQILRYKKAVMRREARDGGSTRGDKGHVTLGRGERSGGDEGVYTFDGVWAARELAKE